jgi:ABC-type amino acid transport substrate-binding protein
MAFARCEGVKPGQRPQNTPHEFVGQTLDEIVARGFIEIAVYENFPPYSWQQDGEPKGIDIGIGRIIAKALGVKAQFRFVQAGETVEADLMNYVWKGAAIGGHVSNVMLRVPYNSDFICRVEQAVLTGQYADERIAIAFSRAAYPDAATEPDSGGRIKDAPVPAFFRYDTVGVQNDSISDFFLTSTLGAGAAAHILRFPTVDAAMQGLRDGKVMAVMGPLAQLQYGAGDGVAVHTPPLPGFSLSRWTLGAAVHQSHRDLGYAVDDAIAAALADGRVAALYADLGLGFTAPER